MLVLVVMATVGNCSGGNEYNDNRTTLKVVALSAVTVVDGSSSNDDNGNGR